MEKLNELLYTDTKALMKEMRKLILKKGTIRRFIQSQPIGARSVYIQLQGKWEPSLQPLIYVLRYLELELVILPTSGIPNKQSIFMSKSINISSSAFLKALRDTIRFSHTLTEVANGANIHTSNLCAFFNTISPRLPYIFKILDFMGYKITIKEKI